MASKLKFSANINTFNACADRYVLEGYGERRNTDELIKAAQQVEDLTGCLLYTSPSPRDRQKSRMPSSA